MSQFEGVNPGDKSSKDLLQCNSMDQVTGQRLDQPADSREELPIDQGQGSQSPASTHPLTSQHLGQTMATSIGDSDSQRNIGENSEETRRHKKRMNDQNYRHRQKEKMQNLENKNHQLKQENDKQKQQIESMLEKEKKLKCILKERGRLCNSLLDRIAGAYVQSMSTADMQQLLARVELAISSLNQKVDELQQNITQLSATQVDAQPWQPQPSILISQDFQAATTTLPLTQLSGASRMQQIFQSPGTLTEDSHVLPDFLPQQQVGQTAYLIDVLPQFSSHQGQGGNSAIEPRPFTQGLSDQYQFSSEKLKSNLEAFEAENGLLKHEIEENERVMKSNMEAFEAKNGKLKLEIGEKEQPMKSNLESFEAENERLKREIEQKKQLMKSNLKAFEARDGKLKHEIQEKQQLVKSNLQTFEAQIRQLVDEFESLNLGKRPISPFLLLS